MGKSEKQTRAHGGMSLLDTILAVGETSAGRNAVLTILRALPSLSEMKQVMFVLDLDDIGIYGDAIESLRQHYQGDAALLVQLLADRDPQLIAQAQTFPRSATKPASKPASKPAMPTAEQVRKLDHALNAEYRGWLGDREDSKRKAREFLKSRQVAI